MIYRLRLEGSKRKRPADSTTRTTTPGAVAGPFSMSASSWSESNKTNYIKHALRENKIHKQLSHKNIVMLYDTIEIDKNSFCTVMEFCNGVDLSIYMKKHPISTEREARLVARQLLSLVHYLNILESPIIHYDIKPQNILFKDGQIKLTDFGLSKIRNEEVSKIPLTSQGVGTYWYLPPECFVHSDRAPRISSKVDIFSIGVIFFELLYGRKPFGHEKTQTQILKERVMLNSKQVLFPNNVHVSKEGKEFIKLMLAHNQDDRIGIKRAFSHPYINKK